MSDIETTAVEVFKAAWHAADEQGFKGSRTMLGIAALRDAGLLADPQPMLDGQIVLSGYCSEDHGHDLDCLFRAARRELATAAEQEQCSECGAGTTACAQSWVKCCPDCKHGWKALCPALAVETRRQRERAEQAEAERDEWKRRAAIDEQQASDRLAAWEKSEAELANEKAGRLTWEERAKELMGALEQEGE